MKLSIRRWLSLAIVPAALALFGAVAPAHAVTFANCNDIPSTGHVGSVTVTQTGDCNIPFDLNYPDGTTLLITNGTLTTQKVTSNNGEIFLSSTNKTITTKDLSAGTVIRVIAGLQGGTAASSITIDGDVISNMTDSPTSKGNIMLRAWGLIKTKNIKTNGTMGPASLQSGAVQIDADMSGQNNVLFTVGSNTPNSVNGNINTRSVNGGGNQLNTVECGARITNGTANSTGGITVGSPGNILLKNSASRACQIELNARKGTITLPQGQLDASGEPGQGAGFIFLLADKIVTANGTKINANQNPSATPVVHQVVIAAKTIEFQGQNGLEIQANGDGTASNPAAIFVVPQGGLTSTSTNNINNLFWTRSFTGTLFEFPGEVNFQGAGTAPLLISANGDNRRIGITGYPVTFTGGDLTIRSRGQNLVREVVIGFFNESLFDGTKGLAFNNDGQVLINVRPENAVDADGGDIQIQTDVINFNTPNHTVTLNAQGPTGSHAGDGGTIFVTAKSTFVDALAKVEFLADGPPLGSGKAQLLRNNRKAIFFDFGSFDINVGDMEGTYSFSAMGGGQSGNGGAIELRSVSNTVIFRNADGAVDASAPSSSADGGQVLLTTGTPVLFEHNQSDPSQIVRTVIDASGGFQLGNGGSIEIGSAQALPLPIGTPPLLNVNALMLVDGGPDEPNNAPYGRIKLNGVECLQTYRGPTATWPSTFWACDGASAAAAAMVAGADSLPQQLRNQLEGLVSLTPHNPEVQVYGFLEESKMNAFFSATSSPTGPAGGLSIERIRVSGVFDTAVQLGGTTAEAASQHELGHQFEYIWGDAAINDTAFLNAYSTDVNAFNALPCTTAFPSGKQFVCGNPNLPNNIARLKELGRPFDKEKEAFADIFEHVSQPYQIDADFPVIFDHFSQMIGVMQMRIANPPAPQQ